MTSTHVRLGSCIVRISLAMISVVASISLSQAGILSNANVDPCIHTSVLDGGGNNVCITSFGNVGVTYLSVGTTSTGGVAVAPGLGTLTVTGASTLTITSFMSVGDAVPGYLDIQSGGQVVVGDNLAIGNKPMGFGNINVGSGSGLTVANYMTVGNQSTDISGLFINAGGTFTQTSPYASLGIGYVQASQGLVVVDGGQFNLPGQNSFVGVGDAGTGGLIIENGGEATVSNMAIGNLATGLGRVGVTGGSGTSTLTVTNRLTVGDQNTGSSLLGASVLSVGSGGIVNLPSGRQSYLGIGESGFGSLNIYDGGQVSAANMTIGDQATGFGGVHVGNGSGQSTLTIANNLIVGNQSIGTSSTPSYLDIHPGGIVMLTGDNSSLAIGYAQGSRGIVVVSSGELILSGQNSFVSVGDAGTGTLGIQDGGKATISYLAIGNQATGLGGVYVGNGSGESVLTVANILSVGSQSTGTSTLTINSGGTVTQTSDNAGLPIGYAQGSNGGVLVDGGKLTLNGQHSYITVGDAGTGNMTVQNGGQVTVASMTIGDQTTGNGFVTITDTGSSLAVAGNLTVGNLGNGTLTVDSGGIATVGSNAASGTMTIGGQGNVVIGPNGMITVYGNLNELPDGALTFNIDGYDGSIGGPSSHTGFLYITGAASINGAINIALSGFTPVAGQHWDIARASSGLENLVTQSFSPFNVTVDGSPLPKKLFALPCISPATNDLEIFLYNKPDILTDKTVQGVPFIKASFTPGPNISLEQAYTDCGFTNFNWAQIITIPAPSPYMQVGNPAKVVGQIEDPPPGGWTYEPAWNSYPFYWDMDSSGPMWSLDSNEPGGLALNFFDSPGDPCLLGGSGSPCEGQTAGPGSKLLFTTELVGVLPLTSKPAFLDVRFDWSDTYNCGFFRDPNGYLLPDSSCPGGGGIEFAQTASYHPAAPGGTGDITILDGSNVNVVSVPEPPSIPLVGMALCIIAGSEWHRRRKCGRSSVPCC